MRPIYVSSEDNEKAVEVMQQVKPHILWSIKKTQSELSIYDFKLVDRHARRIVALVEVKNRTNLQRKYPTYMISKLKVDSCVEEASKMGAFFLLVVKWSDDIGWINIDRPDYYPAKVGGRFDRNDNGDVESVYHIPVKEFKPLPDLGMLLFADGIDWRQLL